MSVRRASSSAEAPLSPSAIPDLAILPKPQPPAALPVGQLVSKTSKFDPTNLEDRDYDDIGTRWYKDVIIFNTSPPHYFVESLGGTHFVQKTLEEGTAVGTIEAEEQRVRLLKDPSAALKKMMQAEGAKQWYEANKDAGFVVASRQVSNASYKRARLIDRGNGNFEVVREVGGEGKDGVRRDSGLEVTTNSKDDVVGVVIRRVVEEGGEYKLGEELEPDFWNESK